MKENGMLLEDIKREINLSEDEGCIIFDFGCFFPYSNNEILKFDFYIDTIVANGENGISTESKCLEDIAINHRYPNKNYQTISMKQGNKISKLGYPYKVKLNEQLVILYLNIGIKDKYVTLIFPLLTWLSKESPICKLNLQYDFDKNTFFFTSFEKLDGGELQTHTWLNYMPQNRAISKYETVLSSPSRADNENNVLWYDDRIVLYPLSFDDFLDYSEVLL